MSREASGPVRAAGVFGLESALRAGVAGFAERAGVIEASMVYPQATPREVGALIV